MMSSRQDLLSAYVANVHSPRCCGGRGPLVIRLSLVRMNRPRIREPRKMPLWEADCGEPTAATVAWFPFPSEVAPCGRGGTPRILGWCTKRTGTRMCAQSTPSPPGFLPAESGRALAPHGTAHMGHGGSWLVVTHSSAPCAGGGRRVRLFRLPPPHTHTRSTVRKL